MAHPKNKELKLVNLELSGEYLISMIPSNINNSHERRILLDRFPYPSDYLLAEFSSRVYTEEICFKPLEQGWVLLTTANNSGDGYFGAAYWNPGDQQVVIAHKGTQNQKDFWTDYQGILSNKYTSQMSSAVTFSNNIAVELDKLNKNQSANLTLSITGHSLGGWLAQITAFSTQYLTKGESNFFVKNTKEGCHTHTVVFDSPGCKDMLLKMESDFDVRYSGMPHTSFFLDVTIYLSAPNLVNTLHSHLNVGNLYRVFIEDLPKRTSSWDLFQYTIETHNMDKIKKAIFSVGNSSSMEKIMKVIDWPLVKEGLGGMIVDKLSAVFTAKQNEYEYFHKFANCTNYYNPPPDDDKHCTLRYQVQGVVKEECSANIFTHSEFDFLTDYLVLRQLSMFSIADDVFLKLEQKSKGEIKKDKLEDTLKSFEIKGGAGRGFIKCGSQDELQKLIICVKNILFIFPNIHTEIKDKLKNLDVYNDIYEKQSLDYLQSIEYIEIKEANMKIVADFLNNGSFQFLPLICKVHPVIGVKKIEMFLKGTKDNYQTSKAFFLSLEQLMNLDKFFALKEFVKQVDAVTPVLFAVDCAIECRKAATLFSTLFEDLRRKPKFKFILVSQNNKNLKDYLGNYYNARDEKRDDSKIKFDDLTDYSQKQLLKKTIYFQGEKISLGTLITDETKCIIDEGTLSKLINNETIEIGKALPDLGDVEKYYIDRVFNQSKIKKLIKDEFKIYITYNNEIKKHELVQDQDLVLVSESGANFDELCIEYKNHNIHWLKEKDNRFVWQKSRGALSRLREYLDTDCVSECFDIDERIVVISAVSGAGKSTALTKLAKKMKTCDASLWVVRVNLNDYTGKLANEDFGDDKDKMFNFLMDIACLSTSLERELFKYKLNDSDKVALLFDGFDEIVPDYKVKVDKLLNALKHSKVDKLWITTRPHMKNELEDILSVLSYNLRPLSREDQEMFLRRYFSKALGHIVTIGEDFDINANILLDCLLQSISDKNKEFTGIPLHLKMLAEAFQKEFKTSYTPSNKIDLNVSKKLNLMDLYGRFIVSKFERHLAEKLSCDLTKLGSVYEKLYASFMKEHSSLALSTFFCEEDLNQFLNEEELSEMKKYKKQVKEGKENSGLISHTVGEKPIFIHYSFSEYFAAIFFFNNIKRIKIKKFYCDQVYGKNHDLISIFFDYMVSSTEDNCEVHIAVLNNDEDKVKQLLSSADKLKDITNARDKVGRTALHLAAAYGYFDVTMTLLDNGFGVVAEDQLFGWRPMRYADKNGNWEIAEIFLRNGANADDMTEAMKSLHKCVADNRKKTVLHEAAEKGSLKILNALLENKKHLINAIDQFGKSPLHFAVNKEVVEFLISNGADIEAKDHGGRTPLFIADSVEVAEALISQHADVNARSNGGNTPLHEAVEKSKAIVKLLVSRGADIEARNHDGKTPLFYADSEEDVEFLISQHADVNARNNWGITPLHSAVKKSKKIVEILVSNGADIEAKDGIDMTPLFSANSKEVVEFLISQGADVNARNDRGSTPLHKAVKKRKEIVELLVSNGADIEAKDDYNETPLFFASSVEVVEFLISQGADIKARNKWGNTPLHEAVQDSIEIVKLLVSRGADIEARNLYFRTPLFRANSQEVIEFLLSHGADIEAKDHYDETPLFKADSKEVVECLISQGADINARNRRGDTLLHEAARKSKEIVKLFILHGADIEAKNLHYRTPIFYANNYDVVEFLLLQGADGTTRNSSANTLFHERDFIEILMSAGAVTKDEPRIAAIDFNS